MSKQPPQRTCIATGVTLPQAQLWRFAAGLDGQAHLDLAHKAPGRGAYLAPTKAAFDQALKRKAFERHLDVAPPAWDNVTKQLTKRLLNQLGLARKSGQLVVGTDNTHDAWRDGKVAGVFMATDAAANTVQRVTRWGAPTCHILTKTNYEQALGVANCTVIGVQTGNPAWDTAMQLQGL